MKINKIAFLIVFIFSIQNIYAQCSDAGVCILGERHKKTQKELTASSLSFQYSIGFSGNPEEMVFHTFKFGGDYALSNNFSLSAVLPVYSIVYKDGASLSKNGIGDAIVIGNYSIPTAKNQSLAIQGGFKLNTSSIDKEKFGYINGQGTNDIIIGADFNYSFFSLSGGFQVPLTNYENNGFKFKRGADFMIKGGFQRKAEDFKLRFELLGIKRLTKSEIDNNNTITVIEKSDFFQLNILGGISYNISNDILIDLGVALPMIKREENSDGTKRVFTANIGIRYSL